MLYCQHCSSSATIKHRPGCPNNVEPEALTGEERTLLAHYRGECHNSTNCAACQSERGWVAILGTRDSTIDRLEAQHRQDVVVGVLNTDERVVVRHLRGQHNDITVTTCALCEQRTEISNYPAVDDVQLNNAEVLAVRHLRNEHTSGVYGCTACTLRKSRDSAEAKVRTQEGTIRRQTATITALEAGVRDAQQRLNSIIEG
jgi:hypothetical protein